MFINDRKELKDAYEMVLFIKSLPQAKSTFTTERREFHVYNYKKAIRAYLKEQDEKLAERRVVKDYDDHSFIEKINLSANFNVRDKDHAEEIFEEWYRMRVTPTPYDCTGEAFTAIHKIFKMGDHWVVYHWIDLDI